MRTPFSIISWRNVVALEIVRFFGRCCSGGGYSSRLSTISCLEDVGSISSFQRRVVERGGRGKTATAGYSLDEPAAWTPSSQTRDCSGTTQAGEKALHELWKRLIPSSTEEWLVVINEAEQCCGRRHQAIQRQGSRRRQRKGMLRPFLASPAKTAAPEP